MAFSSAEGVVLTQRTPLWVGSGTPATLTHSVSRTGSISAAYLDDVIIHGDTWQQRMQQTRAVVGGRETRPMTHLNPAGASGPGRWTKSDGVKIDGGVKIHTPPTHT